MTPEEVEQIVLEALAALPVHVDNVHLHFHWHGTEQEEPIDPEDPPDEGPATRTVEMTDSCAFFFPVAENDVGAPIFENALIGKTVPPERWEVYLDWIQGDGGIKWWQIWSDVHDYHIKQDYYIRKDKTKLV